MSFIGAHRRIISTSELTCQHYDLFCGHIQHQLRAAALMEFFVIVFEARNLIYVVLMHLILRHTLPFDAQSG